MNSNHAISKIANAFDVRNAKATDKPIRLRCGNSLFLHVTPKGTKTWRCYYRRNGILTDMKLGHYLGDKPGSMSLADARLARMNVRKEVQEGGDPAAVRQAAKTARQAAEVNTFKSVAADWQQNRLLLRKWSARTARHIELRLEKYVFPAIGKRPIAQISFKDCEAILLRVFAAAPAQTVHIKQHMGGVFDYAHINGLMKANPLRTGATFLPKRKREDEQHQPRVVSIEEARAVLQAVESSQAGPGTILAHRLIALTAVRKQEALGARWSEFSSDLWTIPKERMKQKLPHLVPLSPQAQEVIEAARAIAKAFNQKSDLVFLSARRGKAACHRSGINKIMGRALVRVGMGKEAHVVHGWRGTFSTLMNERYPLGDHHRIIEIMLAHRVQGVTAQSYNSADYMASRRALAREWADLLLDGAPDAFTIVGLQRTQVAGNVVQLRKQEAA
jgi:integrase